MIIYGDNDGYCTAWLRNLIREGLIPDGYVDERDIADVQPEDIKDCRQFHAFAGIGGWPLALELAGWPADQPVWTGSCPCQPFSAAGKQAGFKDERDLWPAWFRLIRIAKPPIIFGEQVSGAVGFGWFDRVCADLEAANYAVGAAVLPACSVGAPHIRTRLFWVATLGHAGRERRQQVSRGPSGDEGTHGRQPDGNHLAAGAGEADDLANPDLDRAQRAGRTQLKLDDAESADRGLAVTQHSQRWPVGIDRADGRNGQDSGRSETHGEPRARGQVRGMAESKRARQASSRLRGPDLDAGREPPQGRSALASGLEQPESNGRDEGWAESEQRGTDRPRSQGHWHPRERPGELSAWAASTTIYCLDGKWRRIPLERRLQPLANVWDRDGTGVDRRGPRVQVLRAAGNAIVPAVAAEFIRAMMSEG